jgi:hypothetical protein
MVTTFLFWNLARKPLEDLVVNIVREESVDVVILAECEISLPTLLRRLGSFHLGAGFCRRIKILTRFSSKFLTPVFESERVSIRRLALPKRVEVLLAAVHLPSKLYFSGASQAGECAVLAKHIAEQERLAGHRRTILVGDFNMNPFEVGLISASGLHGVMSRSVARQGVRAIQGRSYPFFYNPMWNHLGDDREPAGTYYYERAEHVNYFWNVFDQVLVRPDLMDNLKPGRVAILTKAGGRSLLTNEGRPDKLTASDHLPVLFVLDL